MGATIVASAPADALQCVPFAREISGISIRGDAWTWWNAAAGQYDRGQAPRIGAVVVFKKFAAMHHGHVAVVARVVNNREVLVDHANWAPHRGHGRGQISKMVAVTDVSSANDWSEVRVWNSSTRDFGTRTYPTYGFIYPMSPRAHVQTASLTVSPAVGPSRRSSVADPVMATADQQIAAALAEACQTSTTLDAAEAPAKAKPAEARVIEAKAAEVKPAETTVSEAKPPEGTGVAQVAAAEPRPAEIKPADPVVSSPVPQKVEPPLVETKRAPAVAMTPAPVQVASSARVSQGQDGVWEGDLAAAEKVGAGRY